jgi:hypothetical protein
MSNLKVAAIGLVFAVAVASPRSAMALTLQCRLASDPVEAENMGRVNRFVIDEGNQSVDMYLPGQEAGSPEWSYQEREGDVFDQKGDIFVVRSDVTGIYGSGIRAGFPQSFYFNSVTKLMTWSYIWKDKVTRMQWQCRP